MTEGKLFDSVLAEMDRVWGADGFDGEFMAYAWLAENYGITIEEDNKWGNILAHFGGYIEEILDDHSEEEAYEIMSFLEDDARVTQFLESLLLKYRSSSAVYHQYATVSA